MAPIYSHHSSQSKVLKPYITVSHYSVQKPSMAPISLIIKASLYNSLQDAPWFDFSVPSQTSPATIFPFPPSQQPQASLLF
jgi:hypothetical protein